MKRIFMPVCVACAIASATVVQAETWVVVVSEAAMMAVNGNADAAPEELAADAAGNIIVVDEGPTANEHVLRFDSTGGSGIKVTDETAIIAAIEAVNGTASQTVFTINSVSVAADGDYILTNGDSTAPDSMVSVTPAGVITVLCTAVNAATSPIEGCTGSTVIGNTAYVTVNGAFGAVEDAVLAVDTNGGGAPAIAASTLASQAAIEAVITGGGAGAAVLGPLCAGGTGLYVADSGGSGTTDDIVQIALPGGAVSMLVEDTAVETALATTDVGYIGMAVNAGGSVFLTNGFGTGASDDALVKVAQPGTGSQAVTFDTEASVAGNIGATQLGVARMGYNSVSDQILFANQFGETEGIIGVVLPSASASDWSLFN